MLMSEYMAHPTNKLSHEQLLKSSTNMHKLNYQFLGTLKLKLMLEMVRGFHVNLRGSSSAF